jgi:hypothetical protein
VVDLSAQPSAAPPPAAAANPAVQIDRNELMLGGGALALVALAAAAIAMRRRRRLRLEEEEAAQYDYVEPAAQPEATPQHDPIFDEQPAIVAPPMSAFSWDDGHRQEAAGEDCDERESWTERARCGPTADNPSLSLKKRMKRAAFFEQREREIAAGETVPVESDAGLPDAMDEPADGSKSELERA